MSGITLSASVRQNLLSLQSTADLLSTTQNRLSTGKKVNTALDNPTNFFTAASLDSRAGDINNLLDGIGNGVQVLQAANTGITSLTKLIDSAKSIANQVLQTPVGYASKSSFTTPTNSGATTQNILGTASAPTDATLSGTVATGTTTSAYTSTASSLGAALHTGTSAAVATGSTLISALTNGTTTTASGPAAGDVFTINGKTITFAASGTATNSGGGNYTIGLDQSLGSLLSTIDTIQGSTGSSVNGSGQLVLSTGTAADLTLADGTGSPLAKLGLSTGNNAARGGGTVSHNALTGATLLKGTSTASAGVLSTQFAAGDTLTVNGKTISFYDSGAGGAAGTVAGVTYLNLNTATATNLLSTIDTLSGNTGVGTTPSTITGGQVVLHTGLSSDLNIVSSNTAALSALGLGTSVSQPRTAGTAAAGGQLANLTLTIPAVNPNAAATNIVFGTGVGQVSTLAQLNAALSTNFLQATIDASGALTITTSNDAGASTIGAVGGTAAATGKLFAGLSGTTPVIDPASQATRQNLVAQYNNVITQITTTSQDSSFNGINLLAGDTLKLTFNETGKSTLNIQGTTLTPAGLGLRALTTTDFLDNTSANNTLVSLGAASTILRSQASALGSNLSIVQIRQDFAKNLINVLQTGSSQLTLADTNEEAANSQALSTRQSIAVSALALANQSQQSVLKLLQ